MNKKVFLCTVFTAILSSTIAYADPIYAPWKCGDTYMITQGNSTQFSHYPGSADEYAWDIGMQVGTKIAAPQGGYVIGSKSDSNVGGPSLDYLTYANWLTICMDDGRGAIFWHLDHNGVLLKDTQRFEQGDIIAISGNTGYTTGAHLHFAIIPNCSTTWAWSVPAEWADFGVPETNDYITSNNCPKPCEPSPEVCDNKDNDCDGSIDEDEVCYEDYDIKYQAMNYDPQNTDINGDGRADICIRGSSGVQCMISNGKDYTKYSNLLPEMSDENGWGDPIVYRTIRFADINGDGKADICARRNTGIICWPSQGTSFGAATPVLPMSNEEGYADDGSKDGANAYLSSIRFGDINGDKKDDFCARFKDSFKCYLSNGNGFDKEVSIHDLGDSSGWEKPYYTSTIRMADVDGDGKMDVCARGYYNVYCWFGDSGGLTGEFEMNNWGWEGVWKEQKYYASLRFADINGDGKADLCGRDANGVVCQLSTGRAPFGKEIRGPGWADINGWDDYDNYSTLMFGDLNGDGKADVCARANAGVLCHLSTGDGFNGGEYRIDDFSDEHGWNKPEHFRTLRMGDIDGDGRMDICGRGANGVACFLFNGKGFTPVTGPAWKDGDGWADVRYYSTFRLGGPFGTPCSKRKEICDDHIDNNCDGQVDEGCALPCTPSAEVCDGVDNDCDGLVDEDLECKPAPECTPSAEVCDGVDNDCDGLVDEDLECSTSPECTPSAEVCDGIDNDCDGLVDEDLECSTSPECTPSAEVCDGIDNDCDGLVDEDLECKPAPECTPSAEVCDGVDNDCDGLVDEDLECKPVPECTPSAEVCDGVDNDCDGLVDENSICDTPEQNDPQTPDSKTECESPEGCTNNSVVDMVVDEDCGCSIKRTPASNGGLAWMFGLLSLAGLARMRKRR